MGPVIVVCPTYNNENPDDSADYSLALQLTDNYHNELVELVKLFCNTYKEKFRQDHACILFSNGVIYPLDECGRI